MTSRAVCAALLRRYLEKERGELSILVTSRAVCAALLRRRDDGTHSSRWHRDKPRRVRGPIETVLPMQREHVRFQRDKPRRVRGPIETHDCSGN